MKKKNITFIIPFFGNAPLWMDIFLKSCLFNQEVSFLIFTDCMPPGKIGNIQFIAFDLDQMRNLAEKKLQLPISLVRPYKICDFRPAFGIIFEDYLKDSMFWGTCDVDLLFGDIRKFVTDQVLSGFDIITAKRQYLVGHFTLYRNTRKINTLFKKSCDFMTVFQHPKSFAFDECNFLWKQLLAGEDILKLQSEIQSMSHVVKKFAHSGIIRAYFESHVLEQDRLDEHGGFQELTESLCWENGKLFDPALRVEYLSFHFHFLKKNPAFCIPSDPIVPDKFQVSKHGFLF